jgi:sec-independent protein translocase protein TatB
MRKEVAPVQMFGVGILELMVILILTVIVVGPDRMPQVAADLAKWIRQTRAYARHLMGDFNSVVADLEKEAGASREDWKEIASVVTRHTGSVGQELSKLGRDVEKSGDLAEAKADAPVGALEAPSGNGNGNGHSALDGESTSAAESSETTETEEKPWYVPEKTTRRRSSE